MQNAPGGGMQLPKAFADHDNRKERDLSSTEEYLTAIAYLVIAVLIMWFLGYSLKMKEKWVTKNVTQKNEFRFGLLAFIVAVTCGVYLLYKTRNSPTKERVTRMKDDNPVAAYTMTVAALIDVICTFLLFTYLIGPFGIIFWGAFWVAFYQALFLLP